MPQPLEEHPVFVLVIEVESHEGLNRLEIYKLGRLLVEVLCESVFEPGFKVIWFGRARHELHLGGDPLGDYVHALRVKFLRATEFKVSKALFEAFTDADVFEFFFDEVAGVWDQIESYLEIPCFDKLVEHWHRLLEDVELLDFLPGDHSDFLTAL